MKQVCKTLAIPIKTGYTVNGMLFRENKKRKISAGEPGWLLRNIRVMINQVLQRFYNVFLYFF